MISNISKVGVTSELKEEMKLWLIVEMLFISASWVQERKKNVKRQTGRRKWRTAQDQEGKEGKKEDNFKD